MAIDIDLTNKSLISPPPPPPPKGNVSVQKYFRKRRGAANGIFMAGGSLGNITIPLLPRCRLIYSEIYIMYSISIISRLVSRLLPSSK